MKSADVTKNINGYALVWPELNLTVKISRVREHSEGDIKGYLQILNSSVTSPRTILANTSFNFSSEPTRHRFAKDLSAKYPKAENEWGFGWTELFDYLGVKIQDLVLAGEPAEEFWTGDSEIVAPRYMLHPLIIENYPNVLFGMPSTFKSGLSIALSACVLLPWTDNPLWLGPPDESQPVLYLDWETDAATVKWQASCFARGMELPSYPMHYMKVATSLKSSIEKIGAKIERDRIKLIIIDSLGLACGRELNEAETAIEFFTSLRQLNTTSLILAHTSKTDVGTKSVYGSVFFEAQARNVWQIQKVQEKGSPQADLLLRNTKSPPFAKPHNDIAYHLEFTENSYRISKQDPKGIPAFLEQMSKRIQILEALKDGKKQIAELVELLGIEDGTVRKSLYDLKQKGQVVKLPDGSYGLSVKSPEKGIENG